MIKPRGLSVDIETRSDVDLKTKGVYLYVKSPKFALLWITFCWLDKPNEPVTIDMLKVFQRDEAELSKLKFFRAQLMNNAVLKYAYNATFERVCLSTAFKVNLDAKYWRCTLIRGAMGGLPLGLGRIAAILNVPVQKDKEGMILIRLFSIPDPKTKELITPNTPELMERWRHYGRYNRDDVLAEMGVNTSLDYVRVPVWEQILYNVDAAINDRGVRVDIPFIKKVLHIMEIVDGVNFRKAFLLSGIVNPKSTKQVKEYLEDTLNEKFETCDKAALTELSEREILPDDIREFIHLKLALSKTSIAKFDKMLSMADPDDWRIRGLFQLYGAVRTGRWAGRAVQMQNQPRITIKNVAAARRLISDYEPETAIDLIELFHGGVSFFCSQMVRPSFIPAPGHVFVIADYSSIENRISAYLSGETWKLEAIARKDEANRLDPKNTIPDLYEVTASKMFSIDINDAKALKEARQKGKGCELGLGYQGGVNALIRTGIMPTVVTELTKIYEKDTSIQAAHTDVKDYIEAYADAYIAELVKGWRKVNPKVVRFWYDVQDAAIRAITGEPNTLKGLKFFMRKGHLIIKLLSGRELIYYKAGLQPTKYSEGIYFYGEDGFSKKWVKRETYGGSLVENIVQATARDCMAWAMLRLHDLKYKIVMHVHDELVLEVSKETGKSDLSKVLEIMAMPISWAPGLSLVGDGKLSDFYTK